jgi:hypothetical protein
MAKTARARPAKIEGVVLITMQEKELAEIQAQAMAERKRTVCFWCSAEAGALSLRGHYLEDCERHKGFAGQAAIFGLAVVPSAGPDSGAARACGASNLNLSTGTPADAEGRSGPGSGIPKAPANACGPNSRHERDGNAERVLHAETGREWPAFTGGLPHEADQAVMPTDPGQSCAKCAREPVNAFAEDYAGEQWIPDYLRRSA